MNDTDYLPGENDDSNSPLPQGEGLGVRVKTDSLQ